MTTAPVPANAGELPEAAREIANDLIYRSGDLKILLGMLGERLGEFTIHQDDPNFGHMSCCCALARVVEEIAELIETRSEDIFHAIHQEARMTRLPSSDTLELTGDPLADLIAEYRHQLKEFARRAKNEDWDVLMKETFQPPLDLLWHHTPEPNSMAGILAALLLAKDEPELYALEFINAACIRYLQREVRA